jgi:hypothetical protein
MKNKLINIFAILFCVITFAGTGKAQSINHLKFETSFDFIIREQKFPSGKYTVQRLNPADPGVLILRQTDGKLKTVFLTNTMISGKPMEQSQIIFNHSNENYFLTGIWVLGETSGYDILMDKPAPEPIAFEEENND